MEELKPIAREALDAFEAISTAATAKLRDRGLSLESLTVVNHSTAENIARGMALRNAERISDCQRLRNEPAIARIVVLDEDNNRETIYISPVGRVDAPGIVSCSYLSAKGRLAALPVGIDRGDYIRLPSGERWFDVIEKMTFKPGQFGGEWDSRPAVEFRESKGPRTIKSLRELLRDGGLPRDEVDALAHWLAEEEGADNIVEGLMRETLTAMQLRVAALLDQFQDEILRLPVDSQIAVLGPPGTGKTTTLIKRLRRTVDLQHLSEEEQDLVDGTDEAGLEHPNSWIMFTPTELLRLYVKDALGKEGVPVHDQRLKVWDDYRRQVCRNDLGILSIGTRSGMVIKPDLPVFLPGTLQNQIEWFEEFDAFQKEQFVSQLRVEAERLAATGEPRLAAIGRRVVGMVERGADNPLQMIGEIAGVANELRKAASEMGDGIRSALEAPLHAFARADARFLDDLAAFVTTLTAETAVETAEDVEDEVDEDDDDDDEAARPVSNRRQTVDFFRKAMRARAIGQATGRTPGARTRNARLLAFLRERRAELPDLKAAGERLLVQRAARRIAKAPTTWLSGLPLRYRQFRRAMRAAGRWYSEAAVGGSDAQPAEIDAIMLASVSHARAMSNDKLLQSRLGDRRPAILDAVASLRRNQVLIDEATDFSPLQLAIMRNLASVSTDAVFISGDFNQRLTTWGSRREEELRWAVPGIDLRRISITYRQSRKLADFAVRLSRLQGDEVSEQGPVGLDNDGFDPAFGLGLLSIEDRAEWLAQRIAEINRLSNGAMPTIAVLVENENEIEELASALGNRLEHLNIQAVACPKGLVKGQEADVRIFDVQHIKGLEFEAVFFTNVDRLAVEQPELVDRYIYVGATRAATFLGLTAASERLPGVLDQLQADMCASWI
ncbi:ATP-binding domain-containing protein [Erythrobacter tepidarius]|uniref:ATP-binding domain-containing protein n=1 Tax=Erythrobacter tepidarius TaxID=60454 RepID=UPI0011817455|nr:ATP-binding domain-containing protein [Erythrobacter tepidarius]